MASGAADTLVPPGDCALFTSLPGAGPVLDGITVSNGAELTGRDVLRLQAVLRATRYRPASRGREEVVPPRATFVAFIHGDHDAYLED